MFTESEFKRKMRVIGDFPNSRYKNSYPYNCLYWDGTRWWGDCVNIYKSLLNGRDVDNPSRNSYCSNFSETGDCTEWGLISQCDYVDGNFSNINDGHIRFLYMDGHFGASFGEEFEVDGRTVNALECTPIWENGIQYSYVNPSNGARSFGKGYQTNGYWELCGQPNKWIKRETPTPQPTPTPDTEPKYEEHTITYLEWRFLQITAYTIVLKNGSADDYVKLAQEYLEYYGYYDGGIDGDFGNHTEECVCDWQRDKGLPVNGIIDADDWLTIFKG